MLDVTEAGVAMAANRCMKLGAWVVPFCYRRECTRLINSNEHKAEEREQEESIVRSIGEIVMSARRGRIPLSAEEAQAIAGAIRPTLNQVDYRNVFDPHTAEVLERMAPLREENE